MALVIEAGKSERLYWNDLWRYRELLYFLAWRDILVRYKQTVIGVAWSVLRPVLTMLVFTFVFEKLLKQPSPNAPYPILVFSAMLPWMFFANALSECSGSLISNSNLVAKVYFPRLIIPISAVVVSLADFLISFLLLILLMACYRFVPGWRLLALPLFTLLAFAAALGAGLWFAALTVKYRDFRHVVPVVVQLGFYLSPVGYSSDIMGKGALARWRPLYSLNPMVGVIDGFRWAILGGKTTLYLPGVLLSCLVVLVLLGSSIWYFRRTERGFADII